MNVWRKLKIQEQWQTALSQNASGYVLKAYEVGATTTNIPISIDSTGSTTVTTVTLNANGLPEFDDDDVSLYIDQDFTYAIYENAADAAANTNAFFGPVDVYDSISEEVSEGIAAYNNFKATYLGGQDSDPTVDNNGDPLTAGDFYWNRINKKMLFYDGGSWADPTSFNGLTLDFAGYDIDALANTGISTALEAEDIAFNSTGTTMFVAVVTGTNRIGQYTLSTAYDPATAVFVDSYDITPEAGATGDPVGLALSPDGTRMFVLTDNTSPAAQVVWQYNLSTGFDITTVTYSGNSFSVAGQDVDPTAIEFNPGGSKFFIAGAANDAIFEYTLTSFDLSTAAYSGNSFTIQTQNFVQSSVVGVRFHDDGTRMFTLGTSPQSLNEFRLTTGYDITTAEEWSVGSAIFKDKRINDLTDYKSFIFITDGNYVLISANPSATYGIYKYSTNIVFGF